MSKDVAFVEGSVAGSEAEEELIDAHGVGNEVHFAGSIAVPDLVVDTLQYYRDNACASRALLEACVKPGVAKFIFSSSAAVCGQLRTADRNVKIRWRRAIRPRR